MVMPCCMVRKGKTMRDLTSSCMRQVQSVRCITCLPTVRIRVVLSQAHTHFQPTEKLFIDAGLRM